MSLLEKYGVTPPADDEESTKPVSLLEKYGVQPPATDTKPVSLLEKYGAATPETAPTPTPSLPAIRRLDMDAMDIPSSSNSASAPNADTPDIGDATNYVPVLSNMVVSKSDLKGDTGAIANLVSGFGRAAIAGLGGPIGLIAGAGVGSAMDIAERERIDAINAGEKDPGFLGGFKKIDTLGEAAEIGVNTATAGAAQKVAALTKGVPFLKNFVANAATDAGGSLASMGIAAANEGQSLTGSDAKSAGYIAAGTNLLNMLMGKRGGSVQQPKPELPIKPKMTPEELAAKNQQFVDEMQAIPGTVDAKLTVDGQKPVEASATPETAPKVESPQPKIKTAPEASENVLDLSVRPVPDVAVAPKPTAPIEPAPEGTPRYVGAVNQERMDVTNPERLLLQKTYETDQAATDKARGVGKTFEQVKEGATTAKTVDWDGKKALLFAENPNARLTAEQSLGLRNRHVSELRKARMNEPNELPAFHKAVQAAATRSGQDLNAYKIQAEAWENTLPLKDKATLKLQALFPDEQIPRKYMDRINAAKDDDFTAMNNAIADAQRSRLGPLSVLHPYAMFNLLSNPFTHIGNITSTAVNLAAKTTVINPLTAVIDRATSSKSRTAFASETPAYVKGAVRGISDGFMRAIYAAKNGVRIESAKNLEGSYHPQYPILSIPGKALLTVDELFRGVAESGEAYKEAVRQAEIDIRTGKSDAKVGELADYYLKNPTKEMLDTAKNEAARTTFNEDLPGRIQQIASGLNQTLKVPDNPLLPKKIRGVDTGFAPLKIIQPFIEVPFNVSKQLVRNSPIGFLTAGYGKMNKSEAIARATIGSAAMAYLLPKMVDGEIEVTGAIPKSEGEKKQFYAENKTPWAVRINDRWVPLRYFGAWATPLAAAAAYKSATDTKGEKPETNMAVQIAMESARYASDASFFTGISSFLGALEDPEFKATRLAANMGSQVVPASGMQRFLNSVGIPGVSDKWQREAESVYDKILNGTLASKTLPVKLDYKADPVERNSAFPPVKNDPLMSELRRLKVPFGEPGKMQTGVDGEDVRLTPEQLNSLKTGINKPKAQRAMELIQSDKYKAMDDKQKAAALKLVLNVAGNAQFNKARQDAKLDFLKPRL